VGADNVLQEFCNLIHCFIDSVFFSYFHPGSDWVDPNDPNVIAEQELLAAASSIEAAAKKLAQLRPRKKPKVPAFS